MNSSAFVFLLVFIGLSDLIIDKSAFVVLVNIHYRSNLPNVSLNHFFLLKRRMQHGHINPLQQLSMFFDRLVVQQNFLPRRYIGANRVNDGGHHGQSEQPIHGEFVSVLDLEVQRVTGIPESHGGEADYPEVNNIDNASVDLRE